MKKKYLKILILFLTLFFVFINTQAQLATCKEKYLGNIVAGYVPSNYTSLWNAVSAENGCKWGSIEGTRGTFRWTDADRAYNLATQNGYEFRYHAIAWGSQYPSWFPGLNQTDSRKEIEDYMQAVATRYPNIDQIDVLNENLRTHAAGTGYFRDQLGGAGSTGYDWIIWLFQRARVYFPNAKLVINDYGLENDQSAIREQLQVIKVLTDRGLVDGFGTQAHEFNINTLSANALKSSLDLMATGGIPIYVTELDISGDDNTQRSRYETLFPVYWNHPNVAGITIWGYVDGETWKANTGLIKNGTDRPAMTWLRQYMAGRPDVCNTGTPTVSLTAPAANTSTEVGTAVTISATASDANGSVSKVEFYAGATLIGTDNSNPYSISWTPTTGGTYSITAKATDNQGNTKTSDARTITVTVPQGPYNNIPHPIPGTIQAEEFDVGGNNSAYFDDSPGSEVTPTVNFRTNEDVDIENCTDVDGGYNIGYATSGEWLEYTVNVSESGKYDLNIRAACDGANRTISITMDGQSIANNIAIPNTTGWQVWQTVTVNDIELTAGQKIMRITIGAQDYINLNYVSFAASVVTGDNSVDESLGLFPNPILDNTVIQINGSFEYTLVNSIGILIEQGKGNNELLFDNRLTQGTYLLKIKTAITEKTIRFVKL